MTKTVRTRKAKPEKERGEFLGTARIEICHTKAGSARVRIINEVRESEAPGHGVTTLPATSRHTAVLSATSGGVLALTGPEGEPEALADAALLAGGRRLLKAAQSMLAFTNGMHAADTPGLPELRSELRTAISNATRQHAYGDPNAEFPGDRPEAYSVKLTPEFFNKRYGGTLESECAAIYNNDGTQSFGKLKPGFKPDNGYEVDADGMVVKSK